MLGLDERPRTRFEMGIIADVRTPDIETRKNIVKNKCRQLGITLGDNIIDFIATKIKSNIRQIEGTLNKIEALTKIYGTPLTYDQVQNIVKDVITDSLPTASVVEKTMNVVSEIYGISVDDIKSKSRTQTVSTARNICMFVIRSLTGITLKETGVYFGKDHATVLNSINNVEREMKANQTFKNTVNDVIRQVKENT